MAAVFFYQAGLRKEGLPGFLWVETLKAQYIMNIVSLLIGFIVGAALALAAYILIRKSILKGKRDEILEKAEIEAEKIKNDKILQAKEKFLNLKAEHEEYVNTKNNQVREAESRVKQKENTLNQKMSELDRKSKEVDNVKASLKGQQDALKRKEEECDRRIEQANRQIESIAGMTAQEAKAQLMENMKAEARTEAQAYINDTIDEARLNAAKEAKRIVINTIQRTATETAIENAVTTFPIDNDEIKGRIIGREGRNIRALEAATGVEIVVDDTPDAIMLSAFDPVRREVARLALHQLVIDGRIRDRRPHPSGPHRGSRDEGPEAARGRDPRDRQAHLHRPRHPRDVHGARPPDRPHEIPFLLRPEPPAALPRSREHLRHHGLRARSEPEDCQARRPPARYRQGVRGRARPAARPAGHAPRRAVQGEARDLQRHRRAPRGNRDDLPLRPDRARGRRAGRELRVIVGADQVSDAEAEVLSGEIAKKIQDEMTYPGQVKITVIRETRSVAYAK